MPQLKRRARVDWHAVAKCVVVALLVGACFVLVIEELAR